MGHKVRENLAHSVIGIIHGYIDAWWIHLEVCGQTWEVVHGSRLVRWWADSVIVGSQVWNVYNCSMVTLNRNWIWLLSKENG